MSLLLSLVSLDPCSLFEVEVAAALMVGAQGVVDVVIFLLLQVQLMWFGVLV